MSGAKLHCYNGLPKPVTGINNKMFANDYAPARRLLVPVFKFIALLKNVPHFPDVMLRMRLFLLIISLFCWDIMGAQTYTTTKTTKEKALRAYNEGKACVDKGEPALALGFLEKALRADSMLVDAYLAMAEAYDDLRDFFKAETAFEKALEIAPDYAPGAYFRLAQMEWKLDKYSDMAGHLRQYLAGKDLRPQTVATARKMLASAEFAAWAVQHPVPFNPQALPPSVNTSYGEYFPTLTADGEILIFTRQDGQGLMGDENFYKSVLKNGIWQPAVPMDGINTSDNEGAQSISPDGTWIVFTACNRNMGSKPDGSQGSCDLYWTQEKNGKWSEPKPFSATINSRDWDSQPAISADGKSIVFSSRRPGGLGQEDLWVTRKLPGGKWTTPENLGPQINTGGSEQSPYLHPDGQTMYFFSDSLPGMGGRDLYLSRLQPDGNWGRPENLGYPINTKADEVSLFVSLDGKTGYFASDKPTEGQTKKNLNLFAFEMPLAARPQPVTYTKVTVKDAVTGALLSAKAEIIDLATGQTTVTAYTRSDGTALACLPQGRNYALNISKDKYFFYSENFNLSDTQAPGQPFLLEAALEPLPDSLAPGTAEKKPVVLKNIFFETGSSALQSASYAELDRLYQVLKKYAWVRIQINGHTDNVGSDQSNQQLSENRARAVYEYLIGKGIDAARLRFKGFGESKPLSDNTTEQGRAKNRRTEMETF
jgi:outer membrane protein OmpA-like peptidoglycan-associated protein